VASKFFPADDQNGEGQYPLCETDYFRRLGLLCYQCGQALRASYITALDRKYHVDHFTCSVCPTVFGASDSYYEHDGQVYCHYHYSTRFAQRCNGCQTAILKQFVEIFRNGQNQHWHPECYMIHKFWNVRLRQQTDGLVQLPAQDDAAAREVIREEEERMEEKVYRIWSVLSTFEESSAACISDMLLHVSNGGYVDGVLVAKRFIIHVEVLFQSVDRLDSKMLSLNLKGEPPLEPSVFAGGCLSNTSKPCQECRTDEKLSFFVRRSCPSSRCYPRHKTPHPANWG
jgi:LIM domain-containing protein